MHKAPVLLLCLLFLAGPAKASDRLLYFEVQDIFGYSSALGRTIAYSRHPDAEMQKPSLGFDYLQRISGESGDLASLALQVRLAVTPVEQGQGFRSEPHTFEVERDGYKTQPQVYNAYLKMKTPWSYVWIGHNRPAFGISTSLDSHGLLLSTLEMQFGYDRDWGLGLNRDFSWGDVSASATSGSGMPFYQNLPDLPMTSHYLAAARISYGVLGRDNYNAGFSVSGGRTLNTIGYTLFDPQPRRAGLAGADLTVLRDNIEHRVDLLAGEWLGRNVHALFYRLGVNIGEEGRFKIEDQPVYWKSGQERNYQDALCFSFLATSRLTMRTEYVYDHLLNDNRFLLQLYYYRSL